MINNNNFNFWRVPSASGTVCVWLHQNNSFDSVYLICPRFIFDFLNEWKFSLFSHFCTSPDFVFIILFFISEKRNRIPQFFPPVFRWSICLWVEFFFGLIGPYLEGILHITHTVHRHTRSCTSSIMLVEQVVKLIRIIRQFSWSKREDFSPRFPSDVRNNNNAYNCCFV